MKWANEWMDMGKVKTNDEIPNNFYSSSFSFSTSTILFISFRSGMNASDLYGMMFI